MRNRILDGLKGMAMGMAEVVPGVSGGTIALITGIYEKLIYTISSIDKSFVISIMKLDVSTIKSKIDWPFIISLIIGMLSGIVIGVFGITYLFENYPEPLWGFFFGLILASCIYVGKKIENWKIRYIGILILGAIIAYGITIVAPAEGDTSLWYVFISGMIAICALILPGISGSFILLLMGMYTVIIPTLKSLMTDPTLTNAVVIIVFGLGCLTGLAGFSRVMNYLFYKYPNRTLVLLIGFMLGSLNKIWPWRNVTEILDKSTYNLVNISAIEELSKYKESGYKILSEVNVLPGNYWMSSAKLSATILSLIFGFFLLFILDVIAQKYTTSAQSKS